MDEIKFNINELADFLDKYVPIDNAPWTEWFDNEYCQRCESEFRDGKEYGWCELYNKCRYFKEMRKQPTEKQVIKMWLKMNLNRRQKYVAK